MRRRIDIKILRLHPMACLVFTRSTMKHWLVHKILSNPCHPKLYSGKYSVKSQYLPRKSFCCYFSLTAVLVWPCRSFFLPRLKFKCVTKPDSFELFFLYSRDNEDMARFRPASFHLLFFLAKDTLYHDFSAVSNNNEWHCQSCHFKGHLQYFIWNTLNYRSYYLTFLNY